ncbi:cytochrome P450-like protein [Elysia marginata]|uniref:Cytochrome P450-like protein n=1 Tax=Elysia marginata TaxID=1093978 RepID=A0AAV4GWT7_9GAST|nr:cytochrome P450-like protein [Elysia marginata]
MDTCCLTTVLTWAAVSLFLWYIISTVWHYSLFYRLGIPGPFPFPVVGTFYCIMRQGLYNFQKVNYERYRGHKVYGIFDGAQPMMVLRDLDMIKDVCIKHFSCFVNRRPFALQPPADHMMTMLKDDHWKNVRSIVSPAFSSGKIRRMYPGVTQSATNLVRRLKESAANGELVELKDVMSRYSMDVIAGAGFGVETNSHEDSTSAVADALKEMMNFSGMILFITFLCPWVINVFNVVGYEISPKNSREVFFSFVDAAYESRKQETGGNSSKRNDFLQMIIEAQEDEGSTANDNLSNEEAKALKMSTPRKPLTRLDYQELTYLDMCVNEGIRMFPPGVLLDRICNKECTVQGVKIPKGVGVAFHVNALHHDPELWPNPEKFDPERFTPESKANRHPVAHMSFGHGPRNCVGMRLAQLEVKMALAGILYHMTPVPCEKTVYPVALDKMQLKALDGLWVKLEQRK